MTQMIELETKYDKLSPKEVSLLNKVLSGFGKINSGMILTGLSRSTINRAKEGLQITKENAVIIREKLLK